MADSFGIDIPPDLDRLFIIEELLEVASPEGLADEAADASSDIPAMFDISPAAGMPDSGLGESVPLPRQYNITFIEVIIRDPFWAFVFWEIKTQDKEQFEKDPDFQGFYLKVSPCVASAPASAFTIPVSQNDTAWYLGLSLVAEQGKTLSAETQSDQKQYKVELCAGTKEETVLAVSNPFKLPLLHELPPGWELRPFAAENPIVILSGYEDFRVIRNNERLPRTKRAAPVNSL